MNLKRDEKRKNKRWQMLGVPIGIKRRRRTARVLSHVVNVKGIIQTIINCKQEVLMNL